MKRPSVTSALAIRSALAGMIALTLLGPALVAQPHVSAQARGGGDTQTLRIDLGRLPDGPVPTEGVAYNSFLTISGADDTNAEVFVDPEYPAGAILLAPAQIFFDFDAERVQVLSFRYEVFNNNATSFAFATGTAGADFNGHPDGPSNQAFEGIGSIASIEFDALESIVSDIVIEFTGAGPDDDGDGDGVLDGVDNCTLVANETQLDADGDGFGNACDGDLNNDKVVNFFDLGAFRLALLSGEGDGSPADFDGDGDVDLVDLEFLKAGFFAPPGPAA